MCIQVKWGRQVTQAARAELPHIGDEIQPQDVDEMVDAFGAKGGERDVKGAAEHNEICAQGVSAQNIKASLNTAVKDQR